MKRLMISVLSVVLLLTFSLLAFANSGPVYWQGYPSTDVMSIDEHSPIAVDSETLVFDFSDGDQSHYSLSGRVNATYEESVHCKKQCGIYPQREKCLHSQSSDFA